MKRLGSMVLGFRVRAKGFRVCGLGFRIDT